MRRWVCGVLMLVAGVPAVLGQVAGTTPAAAKLPAAQPLPCAGVDAESQNDPGIKDRVAVVDRMVSVDEVDNALEQVKKGLVEHPGDTRLEDALGRVFYRRNELSAAIEAFNAAIRADPCNGRAHYDAWRVEAMAGLYDDAQKQLEIAKRVSPTVELYQQVWQNTQMALPAGVVADMPPHFGFYARHYDCDGIPVRSANVVNATALPAACGHIRRMLEHLPNVRANLVARGAELHIMGVDQRVSDLPEFRNERGENRYIRVGDDPKSVEKVDIDAVAGATGGLYANCPESNLLHLPHDGYGIHDEVCVHEFAHDIMGAGLDAGQRSQIEKAYRASMGKGLWKGAYAATNADEWWAEMSAWYFGAQGGVRKMVGPIPAPGPDALKAYDPEAFALLERIYSGQKQPKVVKMTLMKPVREVDGAPGPNPNEAEVLWVNNGPVRRDLFWVDRGGGTHAAGFLEPYSRRLVRDYIGRFWMIVDPRTKGSLLFDVTSDASEIVVE